MARLARGASTGARPTERLARKFADVVGLQRLYAARRNQVGREQMGARAADLVTQFQALLAVAVFHPDDEFPHLGWFLIF